MFDLCEFICRTKRKRKEHGSFRALVNLWAPTSSYAIGSICTEQHYLVLGTQVNTDEGRKIQRVSPINQRIYRRKDETTHSKALLGILAIDNARKASWEGGNQTLVDSARGRLCPHLLQYSWQGRSSVIVQHSTNMIISPIYLPLDTPLKYNEICPTIYRIHARSCTVQVRLIGRLLSGTCNKLKATAGLRQYQIILTAAILMDSTPTYMHRTKIPSTTATLHDGSKSNTKFFRARKKSQPNKVPDPSPFLQLEQTARHQ